MMIAVAVAMSVIIFVWSQGFLSQTSSAAGGQQSQQNIAAQSSISIEEAVFSVSGKTITIVARNVGSVSETLGSATITGTPSNTNGLTGSAVCTSFTGSAVQCTPSTFTSTATLSTISKGQASTITIAFPTLSMNDGDLINIKVSTSAGTFANQQFTVP